ncbi:MAG: SBBP repeat-containing protein [Saprospiraceae bacterium]|nr:SBBP repeat-containing protein [Saprospiraceae bacterium]
MKAPYHNYPSAFALAIQIFLLAFSVTPMKAQCPKVEAILVDACGQEQFNEFIIIHSGGGFNTADLQLDYSSANNILGQVNNDININNGNWPADPTPCGLMPGNTAFIGGCPNVIAVGPGVNIPANAIVVLQTSAGSSVQYLFSSLCGNGECVYVISSACTRSAGAFVNGGASGPSTTNFSIAGGCNQSIIYNTGGLSGTNGDYYLPLSNMYGNGGCTVPPTSPASPPPNINPLADITVCNSYTLPPITGSNLTPNAAYFTGPNGTGTQYNPGAVITSSLTLYAFDQNGPGCFDQEQFNVTIATAAFTIQSIGNCGNFQFTNQSTGPNPISYSWNFDDPMSGPNNTSTLQSPTHQFSKCDSFNVCLTVTWSGCSASICQSVSFSESVPPVITNCPPSVTLSTSSGQCYYDFTSMMPIMATDNCDPMPTITCIWGDPFGTIMPLTLPAQFVKGAHFIQCEAEDFCGNKSQPCVFTMTIIDTEPPVLDCPLSMSYVGALDANGVCVAQINGISSMASDNCPMLDVMYAISGATTGAGSPDASGTTFSQGTSTVTYTATDMSGNIKTCSFEVEVQCFPAEDDCLVWARNIGGTAGEEGRSIGVDSWGNVYTVGTFSGNADFDPGTGVFNLVSAGMGDIFISKLDAAGNFVWAKQMGGSSNDYGNAIAVDALGNVYTAGQFSGTVDFDPGAGVFNLIGTNDVFVSKLDASGNFVWAKQFGGSGIADGFAIAIDVSGNVYTAGRFSGTADFDPGPGTASLTSLGNEDAFISKLDASGNFAWVKHLSGAGPYGSVFSITFDGSGDMYAAGWFEGTVDFDPGAGAFNLTSVGSTDIFVLKLDAAGNFLWAKQMGGASKDVAYSIVTDASGSVYTTGIFSGTADFDPGVGVYTLASVGGLGVDDIFISKLDAAGNFVWAKGMGGPSAFDKGLSLAIAPLGGVYATGSFYSTVDFDPGPGVFNLTSNALSEDIFVTKLDAAGNFIRVKHLSGPSAERSYSLVIDASGCIYSTGYFFGTVDFDPSANAFPLTAFGTADIFVHKMCPCYLVSSEEVQKPVVSSSRAYPNPFSFSTTIEYHLSDAAYVRLSVFNLLGQEVALLTDEKQIAGEHRIVFDAGDLPSGAYFYSLRVGGFREVKKLVLVK